MTKKMFICMNCGEEYYSYKDAAGLGKCGVCNT